MIEFNDQDSSVFDEVMAVLKHHSAFEQLRFNEENVLSLPGLKIYPDRRKIYRNRREINLTAKEYDLLSLPKEYIHNSSYQWGLSQNTLGLHRKYSSSRLQNR